MTCRAVVFLAAGVVGALLAGASPAAAWVEVSPVQRGTLFNSQSVSAANAAVPTTLADGRDHLGSHWVDHGLGVWLEPKWKRHRH